MAENKTPKNQTPELTPEEQALHENVNSIVIELVNNFIERHTVGQNLNVDLMAIATGLASGRIARMAGLSNVAEVFDIVASAAPEDMQDEEQWHWPEELPLEAEIFSKETAALQEAEDEAIRQMRDHEVEPVHIALSLGMYAIHLAQNAREHVDPNTVLGVYQEACRRGYEGFVAN